MARNKDADLRALNKAKEIIKAAKRFHIEGNVNVSQRWNEPGTCIVVNRTAFLTFMNSMTRIAGMT
jgi:hypothetical protein